MFYNVCYNKNKKSKARNEKAERSKEPHRSLSLSKKKPPRVGVTSKNPDIIMTSLTRDSPQCSAVSSKQGARDTAVVPNSLA
jgi:hypothetical protein